MEIPDKILISDQDGRHYHLHCAIRALMKDGKLELEAELSDYDQWMSTPVCNHCGQPIL